MSTCPSPIIANKNVMPNILLTRPNGSRMRAGSVRTVRTPAPAQKGAGLHRNPPHQGISCAKPRYPVRVFHSHPARRGPVDVDIIVITVHSFNIDPGAVPASLA